MNFKSNQQIIAQVTKSLGSYQAAGLLDEGDFYRWIKEIIATLNVPSYSPVHSLMDMEGGRMEVPSDLHQLWTMWKWEEMGQSVDAELHYQKQIRVPLITHEYEHPCKDQECEIKEEYNTLITKYYVASQPYTRKYRNKQALKVKTYSTAKCASDSPCLKAKSVLEVQMDARYFHFNFDKGTIYIQYYKFMEDEYGPMVPDVVEIERAIETYIVFRWFQEMYYNNEFDALQRMQQAKNEHLEAMGVARAWVKLPSARSLLKMAERNQKKFRIFEL